LKRGEKKISGPNSETPMACSIRSKMMQVDI
jgi:hypothetical protein